MTSETIHDGPYIESREDLAVEVNLTPDDRSWMEGSFRCEWPEEADEASWLDEMNALVQTGSISMKAFSNEELQERYAEIIRARHIFYNRLGIDDDILQMSLRYSSSNEVTALPASFIETQRLFHVRGVDGYQIVQAEPRALYSTVERAAGWMDTIDGVGLDAALLLSSRPVSYTNSATTIKMHLLQLHAAARAAGIEDYRKIANGWVTSMPRIVAGKLDSQKATTRILFELGARLDEPEHIQRLAIASLESQVVAYLEYSGVIRSTSGLLFHAERNMKARDKQEMRAMIADHAGSDDRVIKAYLRCYPYDDPEAEKKAWARHVRARERHKEYPLLWPGPALLGDAKKLSPFRAYATVVDSPPLDKGQFSEIANYILEGKAADEELRDLSIRHDDGEIKVRSQAVDRGVRARQALIARHLGLVVDLAESCSRVADKSEIAAIGNVALTTYVMEQYDPQVDAEERERFRRGAIITIMRYLNSYYPKHDGQSLKVLESRWAADGKVTD